MRGNQFYILNFDQPPTAITYDFIESDRFLDLLRLFTVLTETHAAETSAYDQATLNLYWARLYTLGWKDQLPAKHDRAAELLLRRSRV